jgi:hypothetical protein
MSDSIFTGEIICKGATFVNNFCKPLTLNLLWFILGSDNCEVLMPPKDYHRTITGLKLDIKSAREGKTWLLLPEGFRDQDSGKTYPLPTLRADLHILATIYIPPNKADSGCKYLKRAVKEYQKRQRRQQSALFDTERRRAETKNAQEHFREELKKNRQEIKQTVNEIREEARKQIASLTDLFDLGRKGIDGQMRAHLDEKRWRGEKITAKDFRECFRMVTQTVKGLGLPSTEREKAKSAVVEEAAAALKSTQETVKLSPSFDSETEH